MMLAGCSSVGYRERLTESTGRLLNGAQKRFGPEPPSWLGETESHLVLNGSAVEFQLAPTRPNSRKQYDV